MQDDEPAEANTGAAVDRRGLLQRAAAGLALAAGGTLLAAHGRDGEAAPAPAATFGDVVTGRGAFGIRVVNSSPSLAASGIRAELTARSPGAKSAALRGVVVSKTSEGAAVAGEHRGRGAGVLGTSAAGNGIEGFAVGGGVAGVAGEIAESGAGVRGRSKTASSVGVIGSSDAGIGVEGTTQSGQAGVRGVGGGPKGYGVYGYGAGEQGAGVYGRNDGGPGVWGVTNSKNGAVVGENKALGGYGVLGTAGGAGARGVYGTTTEGEAGVYGGTLSNSGSGVYGWAYGANAAGVYGKNLAGHGVWGNTPANAAGVYGESAGHNGRGVLGVATGAAGAGVRGQSSPTGTGVVGEGLFGIQGITTNAGAGGVGVRGTAPNTTAWAGYFDGKIGTSGGYQGASADTVIDHPVDPANKTLRHAHIASPEMKNVYDGVATTDGSGKATVKLPAYVAALNRDFRYQLTVIGSPANAYISREITDGRFEITTDKPSVKVSWLLTGIRRDAYATRHGLVVEEDKQGEDRGHYLHPEEHGQPASRAIALHRRDEGD